MIEIIIVAILTGISVYLFYKGHMKVAFAFMASSGIVGALWPRRERDLTPFQELDAVQRKVTEAKEDGDAAVIATVPKLNIKKSRRNRWQDL